MPENAHHLKLHGINSDLYSHSLEVKHLKEKKQLLPVVVCANPFVLGLVLYRAVSSCQLLMKCAQTTGCRRRFCEHETLL